MKRLTAEQKANYENILSQMVQEGKEVQVDQVVIEEPAAVASEVVIYNKEAIKKEKEAVDALMAAQERIIRDRGYRATEIVLKKSIFSETKDPLDMAAMVFPKLIVSTKGVSVTMSAMGSNALVRSGKIDAVDSLNIPLVSCKKGKKESSGELFIQKGKKLMPTKQLLGIKIDGIGDDTELLAKFILNNPIWINLDKLAVLVESEGTFFDLLNMSHETDQRPVLDGTWNRYKFFKATPAEIRLSSCVMIDTLVEVNGEYKFDNNRGIKALDFLSHGASAWVRGKGQLPQSKFAKLFARVAQWSPYSRSFGGVPSFWVYQGKFDGDNLDGMSYGLAEYFQERIYEITGIMIPLKLLIGRGLQVRPGLSKTMVKLISRKSMAAKVARLRLENIKMYTGADAELPVFLADLNCDKAVPLDMTSITMDVLMPMVTLCKPSLNMQMLGKLVDASNFDEIIGECYEELVKRRFNFLTAEAAKQTIESVMAGVDSAALLTFAPTLANRIHSIRANAIETAAKAFMMDITKMNLPIKGASWRRFEGDPAGFYGVSILNEGEIYVAGMKEGIEVYVVRFPAACPFEKYRAVTVDAKTLYARIDEMTVNGQIMGAQKRDLIEAVKTQDKNMMLTPRSDRFRNLTGGSDYDSDMGMVVKNKKIVAALDETPAFSFESEKMPKDVMRPALDAEGNILAFLNAIQAPKVGIVCNHVTALLELNHLPKETQIEIVSEVIKSIKLTTENVDATRVYVRHFTKQDVMVTVEEVLACLADMKFANIEDDAVRKDVLWDALVIAKTVLDRTIDAPKSGDSIDNVVLPWKKNIKSSVFCDLTLNKRVDKETGRPYYSVNIGGEYNTNHEGKIAKVRLALAERFANYIQDLLLEKAEVSDKEIAFIAGTRKAPEYASFVELKNIYSDISAIKRAEADTTDNDFMARRLLAWYKPYVAAIENMGLMMAAAHDRTSEQIGKLALAASTGIKGNPLVIASNFMSVVFSHEAMQFAAKHYNANTVVTQEIYAVNGATLVDGEVLEMRNGSGYRAGEENPVAVCGVRLDGEFTVEQEEAPGTGFYVKQEIRDLFAVPKVNGSVLLRVHRSEFKGEGCEERLDALLKSAAKAKIYCPIARQKRADGSIVRDALMLFDNNGKHYADIRISIEEAKELQNVLHGKTITITSSKHGKIDLKNGETGKVRTLKSMIVLGNLFGANTPALDTELDEESIMGDAGDYYAE